MAESTVMSVVGVDDGRCVCWRGMSCYVFFFFSSRRRHTRYWRDWSSDVCSSDLIVPPAETPLELTPPRVRDWSRSTLVLAGSVMYWAIRRGGPREATSSCAVTVVML